jgi:hypothetical protein
MEMVKLAGVGRLIYREPDFAGCDWAEEVNTVINWQWQRFPLCAIHSEYPVGKKVEIFIFISKQLPDICFGIGVNADKGLCLTYR